jgi:hypothetical protein
MPIVAIVLIIALCIPILAILVDSPIGRAVADRLGRPPSMPPSSPSGDLEELRRRMELLEGDVEILQHTVTHLREENQFLQQLLEDGTQRRRLPDPS